MNRLDVYIYKYHYILYKSVIWTRNTDSIKCKIYSQHKS